MASQPTIRPGLAQRRASSAASAPAWDLNHYWGMETRFAWSTGHFTDRLLGGEINCSTNTFFWDLDLLYYPWGDTRWRPSVLLRPRH